MKVPSLGFYVWRLGHARRRALECAARAALRAIIQGGMARRLPRRLLAACERCTIAAETGRFAFDAAAYAQRNPDVRAAGAAPLGHYLRFGWMEGRAAHDLIDELRYRRQAGLTPADRISAFGHFLAWGRDRGLGPQSTRAAMRRPNLAGKDEAAAEAALARLARVAPRPSGVSALVDVVVPVFDGRAETLNCLAGVLEAANETPFTLVVVDDHGPDPRLRADIAVLARRGLIERLVPPRNLGFPGAINLAAERAGGAGRDMIWLNADTEVHGDWIDRLRRVAHSAPDIATVTPLTNNGTICSYPRFDTDNCEALEAGWAELDRLAAHANRGTVADLPTCVGFAVYVRRDALDAIGPLDAVAFGRGYGEENDFSQRAIRAGWRNLAAGEVFVRHIGQCSFGAERTMLVDRAMRRMARRHPHYHRDVAAFAEADPMALLRRNLDLARLSRLARGQRRILIVTHSRGGGTAQHVTEEIGRLSAGGAGVVVMSGGAGGPETARLWHPAAGPLPALAAIPLGGAELVTVLGQLGITEVRLHHLADFGRDGARMLSWLIDAADLPYEVTVHDYLAVCPRINLADAAGHYCGEPDPAGCQRCLRRRRSEFGAPDIRTWRAEHRNLLAGARLIRVPDRDVAARLSRYFPSLSNIVVRPHERGPLPVKPVQVARRRDGALRIAAIGAIGPIKGFDVLLDLARSAPDSRVEVTVVGHTRNDAAAGAAGLNVTGRYRNDQVQALISQVDPDLLLIPSIWPETYCYTLSHALASGRPVAGFDIGAVGSRLADAAAAGAFATVLPLALARQPAALLEALEHAARMPFQTAPEPKPAVILAETA